MTYDQFDDLLGVGHKSPESTIPEIMSESELAAFLGITAPQVRSKARDGIVVRTDRGRFAVRASLKNYLAQLREHASKVGRPTYGSDELKAEKLRLAREQADKLELQNAMTRGEMLSAKSVENEWASILRDVRAGMLAVPGRLAARLNLGAHDLSEIDREIRDALEVVGNGNAE